MRRLLPLLAALNLPLQAVAAELPRTDGLQVMICTAAGPRMVRLDDQGRPIDDAPPAKAPACAHLWCESRRPEKRGRP